MTWADMGWRMYRKLLIWRRIWFLKPILAADWSAPRPPPPTIICCRSRFQQWSAKRSPPPLTADGSARMAASCCCRKRRDGYDFKGNLKHAHRQLAKEYKT